MFTYSGSPDLTSLMQGDVIKRTPAINQVLHDVHRHFFENDKNLFFMVLTQSCDLALRHDRTCKSPYITISPVRHIDDVLSRQVSALKADNLNTELPILTDKAKTKLTEFLCRLYNNNEPGYFFLQATEHTKHSDCCAFLNLSIPIKSQEHYDKCLEAKCLQLETSFQAKLGWLVGQLFSRVGTEDWPESNLNQKIKAALKDVAIWVPSEKLKELISLASSTDIVPNQDEQLTEAQVTSLVRKIPSLKKKMMHCAGNIIDEVLKNTEYQDLAKKLKTRLENDVTLTALLK